ncbi:MAG: ATP-binding protein [Vicinamibacterales bacterium]
MSTTGRAVNRSPTMALLVGLVLTLALVFAYSWYITGQISGLRSLQTELTDRNRRESLQLLRIQKDLNDLANSMRDMLEGGERYPLSAWSAPFARIRTDLDDALKQQEAVALARRTPEQAQYLEQSVAQFWDATDRMFALARAGKDDEARAQIRLTLQARQESLSNAVARLLVQNNEAEREVVAQVQEIYDRVERRVYWFLAATLLAITATSLYLIRTNRRVFKELASLSDERRDVAQTLIATREATLREISRELHDEFGQVLTAIGSMLGRASRRVPDDSPLRADLREIGEVAQGALDSVRGLSQSLHPSILEELGLESTIEWYLSTFERQSGVAVSYERVGDPVRVDDQTAIHVYRVLQEALANVARHSDSKQAQVRLRSRGRSLELEVADRGRGFRPGASRRGLGLVAMRERAALLGGTLTVENGPDGGTRVLLIVPLKAPSAVA